MDLFYTLLFIGLVWMLLRVIFPVVPDLPYQKIGTPGHGHRCYREGLSASEKRVVGILSKGLSHKEYFIFNNLILSSKDGVSTQIDHVVVSKYGIFVIESKEYSGWIFAHPKHERWTATYRTGKKYPFQNPLRQNYKHIMTLKELLPFIDDHFHSVIVFSERCTFMTERIRGVLYEKELIEYIQAIKETKLSPQRLLMAIGKLSYLCQTADMTPEEHIEYVNEIIQQKALVRPLPSSS